MQYTVKHSVELRKVSLDVPAPQPMTEMSPEAALVLAEELTHAAHLAMGLLPQEGGGAKAS